MVRMPETDERSVYTKIIAREIPADIVYEDDTLIAFHDIAPKAPIHMLVVPKTEAFANVSELAAADPALLAHIVATAKSLAGEKWNGDFRLVFNEGVSAGQTISHVHAHVLCGELEEGSLAR
jgi:histidine triad (HIT) family protein